MTTQLPKYYKADIFALFSPLSGDHRSKYQSVCNITKHKHVNIDITLHFFPVRLAEVGDLIECCCNSIINLYTVCFPIF